jgi:type I restriction enzyme R subunit
VLPEQVNMTSIGDLSDLIDYVSVNTGNAYTEEEDRSLSEIIESFNEWHGTQFSREDFLRFERVTREITDEEMTEMVKNNLVDVVYNAFSQAFFQGMVRAFQQNNEMRNIVMTDKDARDQATRHFFKRAQRQACDG